MCSDAPDYGPIAASNAEAAKYAKEAADTDLVFRKQVYEEAKPQYQRLIDLADQVTRQQMGIADDNAARATDQWSYWNKTYRPIEEATVLDSIGGQYLNADEIAQARSMSAAGNMEGVYGLTKTASGRAAEQAMTRAGADVNSAFAQQARNLMRLGGDPNKIASYAAQLANNQALARVGAANQARDSAIGQGISLRSGVANFGRNMPNTAGQATGLAMQAGSQAVGTQNAAYGAGVTYPAYVSGGVAGQQNAAGLQVQGNNALMGAMAQSANQSSPFGQLLGAGLGAYIGRM